MIYPTEPYRFDAPITGVVTRRAPCAGRDSHRFTVALLPLARPPIEIEVSMSRGPKDAPINCPKLGARFNLTLTPAETGP
jgi:hypothetical protein